MATSFQQLLTQKIGPAATGIIALLTLFLGEQWGGYAIAALYIYAAWIDPLIPPPDETSHVFYRRLYPLIQRLCGNTGYNANHCDRPDSGMSMQTMQEESTERK